MSFEEDLRLTATQYLSKLGNEFDRKIAMHLTLATLSFETTNQYSNRWNCFWVIGHLHVPFLHLSFYTEEVVKRLEEVFKILYPKDLDEDFWYLEITPQLSSAYEGWEEKAFCYLAGEGINNQASFDSSTYPMIPYDGMRFRSEAELEIMKSFLKRKDRLVFPLPLARCGPGRREPDFLICYQGKWGILEVISDHTHQSSIDDAERTRWFQKHNLVNIQEYAEDDCKTNPDRVVREFLSWISRQR
ncbi:hypothetical protein H1164_16260 [Thermoactinomyces daqus]|uniref:DUF559 domain-containing protein n=1 Tax=Thermoactinomyces daqus TaxID=1329516 RepID=A0A7W1XCZ8_9BACL|nr:hypothetical protein [Thermoactinomyces daqus]MBA4544400.1 hypothetical protein [Thermoactinomyces daqus]